MPRGAGLQVLHSSESEDHMTARVNQAQQDRQSEEMAYGLAEPLLSQQHEPPDGDTIVDMHEPK